MSPSLPLEIIFHIISYVVDDDPEHPVTAARCVRLCKGARAVAEKALYRRVHLRMQYEVEMDGDGETMKLVWGPEASVALQQAPRLAELVQHLTLAVDGILGGADQHSPGSEFYDTLHPIQSCRSLRITSDTAEHLGPPLHHIFQTLDLSDTLTRLEMPTPPYGFENCLTDLFALQHLHFTQNDHDLSDRSDTLVFPFHLKSFSCVDLITRPFLDNLLAQSIDTLEDLSLTWNDDFLELLSGSRVRVGALQSLRLDVSEGLTGIESYIEEHTFLRVLHLTSDHLDPLHEGGSDDEEGMSDRSIDSSY